MASSADVLRRLEAVAARLEAYTAALPAAEAGAGAAPRRAAEVKEARQVVAYGAFFNNSVAPFIEVARRTTEIAYIGDVVDAAFKHAGVVVQAASKCKKPAQDKLMAFIGPVVQAIGAAEKKVDNRSPFLPQQKSVAEGLTSLNWLVMPGTARDIVQNGLEQADFHLIKLLTAAKSKTGAEQKNLRDFVSTFKAMLNGLGEYVQEFHTTGLDWSPRGIDIASFTPSSSSSAAAAPEEESAGGPPPPPGPPPSAEDLGGAPPPPPGGPAEIKVGGSAPGMGAVFAAISQGLDVTKGLKKVDASQKAKNMKDVPVLVPKEKKEVKAPAKTAGAAAGGAKKPPKLELTKGTWFCENYEDQTIEIPSVEIKQSVYILKARNCTITIPDKCKSISVDGCFKTRIVFRSVVSVFELFNSQRCTADCLEIFPSIAIDKSSGCIVVCSRAGLASPPQVVTSNISECNIQVPGPKDEDDPIEIPIPEQFETLLMPGGPPHKLRTHPIAHGE